MTLTLPPGLLANASIDGGACLTMTDLDDTACQVGTGTVTAIAEGVVPITTPVTFDLVPPPAAGDLAGLAVNSSGTQIGSTADVKVRPSGDPAGVGITITFVLPDTLDGVHISLTEINSTFDGLRYPATCPATPQTVGVAVNSYSDQTVHSVTAPLSVTNCAQLPYAPKFSATATQDTGDRQVKVVTDITQAADESPNNAVSLTLPVATLQPNLNAIGALCLNPAGGTCTPVGSATATSPLYPKPLTGNAYLTGSLADGLTLTLVFPSPFPLTLTGKVDLAANSTTFTGLPDIPLTDLNVTLTGGAHGLFKSNCATPSGTATASLTDQNGDKQATAPATVKVADCTASHAGSGAGTGTSGSSATSSPRLSTAKVTGLGSGRVALRFTISEGKRLAKLDALTVELPSGLSFVRHRVGKQLRVTGVSLKGATGQIDHAEPRPPRDRPAQAGADGHDPDQGAGSQGERCPQGEGQGQEAQEPAIDRGHQEHQRQARHDPPEGQAARALARDPEQGDSDAPRTTTRDLGRGRRDRRHGAAGAGCRSVDRNAVAHPQPQLGNRGLHREPRHRYRLQPQQR